jgi:hypothetical protein
MSRKAITTPVTEDIADGDMDVVRANTLLIAMEAYMEQLKASTTALRQYLTDRTAPNETVKSLLGESTHRRGGESKPKVSDIAAYGAWLYDNGEEDMTDSGYILPVEEALDPKAIAAIMKKHNVSEIPGITWTSARGDSMALRKPSWSELLADDAMRTETAEALGMTGIPQIEAPANDDDEEAFSWETI